MKSLLVCILVLSGCALPDFGEHDPTNKEWSLLTKSYDVWEENINYIDSECSLAFTEIKTYSTPDREEIRLLCKDLLGGDDAIACYYRTIKRVTGETKRIIFYWDNVPDMEYIFYHEFSHFAELCQSGSTGDHSNNIVWDFVETNPLKGNK